MLGTDNERPKSAIATLLSAVMPTSKEGLDEIARKMGFEKPNILILFAGGDARVPIERAPALASALGIDAGKVLRLVLDQYLPASSPIAGLLMESIASENETVLIRALRTACGDTDPAFSPDRIQAAIGVLKP